MTLNPAISAIADTNYNESMSWRALFRRVIGILLLVSGGFAVGFNVGPFAAKPIHASDVHLWSWLSGLAGTILGGTLTWVGWRLAYRRSAKLTGPLHGWVRPLNGGLPDNERADPLSTHRHAATNAGYRERDDVAVEHHCRRAS